MKKSTSTNKKETVYDLLKHDHDEVKELFQGILKEGKQDKETLDQINEELKVHMNFEEKNLYPVLENEKTTRELILESFEEHNLGKELLEKLNNGSHFDEEHWLAKVKVVSDVVEHHVQEEEQMLFPKAKKIIKKDEEERLAQELKAEKEQAQESQPEETGSGTSESGSEEEGSEGTEEESEE